ncbi:TolC family protein [Catenovulum sp. SM1970]|uniref:TolC family protein n=1 Tax=Marinifaba aquimaris TaxID=2741323 RepID=UPI0015737B5C|nr:TolC family protein [Marinifaba aquimaris]NTS77196.1 TolC family protein [Marinifaba aquimaris]
MHILSYVRVIYPVCVHTSIAFLIVVMGLFFPSLPAFAAKQAQAHRAISLTQAIEQTLQYHPDLKAYRFQNQALQGGVQQAQVPAPYELNMGVENAFGSGSFSSVSDMQTSLGIAWVLDSELTQARVALAQAKLSQTELEKQNKTLDVAAATAVFYVTLLAQEQELLLASLAMKNAQSALADVSKRVSAGRAHIVDQYRAKAHLSTKALVVEDLHHEIEATKAQLAAQWGEVVIEQADFFASGQLANTPEIVSVKQAFANLKQHPRMQLLSVQQRVTESAVALAIEDEKPLWQISTGFKHHNREDDVSLMFGVSVPLWTENRNRGQVVKLQAEQNQRQAQTDAWQQAVSTQLLLIIHKLKHNQHVIDGLSEQTIPALEAANDHAEKAYKLGSYSYNDWYQVKEEWVESKLALISAYKNMHLLNIELERLTGTQITQTHTLQQ